MQSYNLCIIKPNKSAFSETFIQAHIDRLAGNIKVLYGGAFPVYDHNDQYLIRSMLGLLSYLIQKRIFKRLNIPVRDKSLVDYFKKEKIQIVLAEYGFTGAMVSAACKISNIPLIIHFHGTDAHNIKLVRKYQSLYKSTFAYASAVIVVSKDMENAIKKLGAPAERIHLLPYGVNTKMFTSLKINITEKNFLSVGRFVEKKSPSSVIKAFKKVTEVYPDARLWMVGEGPLFKSSKELVSNLNLNKEVTFTGVLNQESIYQLMKQMCCFVQHSVTALNGDMEGTPNSILEAAAVGLPVVSTYHAGIKEAVIHEKTGFLVEEHDIDGMAGYMIKIAKDKTLAAELGKNGTAHIHANYNLDTNINKLDKIIRGSLENL